MVGTQYFGYLLVALSAALLAQHWQLWRDVGTRMLSRRDREYTRRQVQRRSVASALIGVVGAAMTLINRVPRTPWTLTGYLFALLLGAAVILAIAVADMRAAGRRREIERLDLLDDELRRLAAARAEAESPRGDPI